MSSNMNPLRSKALIEHEGVSLIEYLLRWASDGGIEDFLISVNPLNRARIEEIATRIGVRFKTRLTGRNFAEVPCLFLEELDPRFFIICGHDPIPSSQVRAMIEKSRDYDCVETAYSNLNNQTENKRRVLIRKTETGEDVYDAVDLSVDTISDNHIYIVNTSPSIITIRKSRRSINHHEINRIS